MESRDKIIALLKQALSTTKAIFKEQSTILNSALIRVKELAIMIDRYLDQVPQKDLKGMRALDTSQYLTTNL